MEKSVLLSINNLFVSVIDKPVLYDISLCVNAGDIHAIMGPNGSGKSSLAYALMGHPSYKITAGTVMFNGIDIATLSVHERAKNGLFLSFQHPCEIPGVSVASFLREAYMATTGMHVAVADFQQLLVVRCEQLTIDPAFLVRGLNDGFSGGEKKRFELLQLLILQPKVAILDEIDSGLDIDSLKIVAVGIERACQENPAMSIVLITHYQRILNHIVPHFVHILCDGRVVVSGDAQVARDLEQEGYDGFKSINP
ncbi:MAG TPA: Fe-S cluster assembly ATPase SufC [Candidatus Babeliales bacterium]|jgi:Fe-S cluster assembly ATP-binding protein|nr:Fe-S cluster assembly ATPase SufC [Candidatus Babeliales bacterium]